MPDTYNLRLRFPESRTQDVSFVFHGGAGLSSPLSPSSSSFTPTSHPIAMHLGAGARTWRGDSLVPAPKRPGDNPDIDDDNGDDDAIVTDSTGPVAASHMPAVDGTTVQAQLAPLLTGSNSQRSQQWVWPWEPVRQALRIREPPREWRRDCVDRLTTLFWGPILTVTVIILLLAIAMALLAAAAGRIGTVRIIEPLNDTIFHNAGRVTHSIQAIIDKMVPAVSAASMAVCGTTDDRPWPASTTLISQELHHALCLPDPELYEDDPRWDPEWSGYEERLPPHYYPPAGPLVLLARDLGMLQQDNKPWNQDLAEYYQSLDNTLSKLAENDVLYDERLRQLLHGAATRRPTNFQARADGSFTAAHDNDYEEGQQGQQEQDQDKGEQARSLFSTEVWPRNERLWKAFDSVLWARGVKKTRPWPGASSTYARRAWPGVVTSYQWKAEHLEMMQQAFEDVVSPAVDGWLTDYWRDKIDHARQHGEILEDDAARALQRLALLAPFCIRHLGRAQHHAASLSHDMGAIASGLFNLPYVGWKMKTATEKGVAQEMWAMWPPARDLSAVVRDGARFMAEQLKDAGNYERGT
ncbi:hypothetical protein GGR56DRAFT_678737 [Xylariaceae sp. FL0804]|nr:hypothetical protein GGR56DRAFT_678737 [Xylariaceae sp. FL0804]